MDLTRKVKVKSGEGKISSPNAFKSFQNLVAKAVGMIDIASFKKDGAGRPSAAIKAKMDQALFPDVPCGREPMSHENLPRISLSLSEEKYFSDVQSKVGHMSVFPDQTERSGHWDWPRS
jgi:hypothetical protein